MSKKTPPTESQRAAGKRNLVEFNKSRGGKPALKHGVGTLIKTGEMPPVLGAEEIERDVATIICGIVQDLGGGEAVTNAQRVILSGLRLSLLVQGLAELHLKSAGLVNKKTKKANSLLTVAATFINSARLGAVALGLDRRARKIGPSTLAEYLESRPVSAPDTDEAPR